MEIKQYHEVLQSALENECQEFEFKMKWFLHYIKLIVITS